VPDTECLADVVERMLPYWYDRIVADLGAGNVVLVSAHGNSLRALVKHLDGISESDIVELNIPTGEPLVYELGDDFHPLVAKPTIERYLRSPDEIAAAAEAVARQAGGGGRGCDRRDDAPGAGPATRAPDGQGSSEADADRTARGRNGPEDDGQKERRELRPRVEVVISLVERDDHANDQPEQQDETRERDPNTRTRNHGSSS
jgi:2,3-bisphosphoglycerate-dependent phosphoglycerate mutase